MALIDESDKKRFRRDMKRRRKTAVEFGQQADQQIEKLLVRRFDRLVSVRRFLFLWIALVALLFLCMLTQIKALSPYYQQLKPAPGGIFTEGMVGTFTNANPLYATGNADTAISHLIFPGLLKYDKNNNLIGDLAEKWQLQPDQRTYVVTLKKDLKWQDGQPLTADDVIYTYNAIQQPETQSPLQHNWEGIVVTKQNDQTIVFKLPDRLAAFPYSLTNGILPNHLLKDVAPDQLRTNSFNTNPVGAGPFLWKFVEVSGTGTEEQQQKIGLGSNKLYYAGSPKLDGFSVVTFADEQHLIKAFNKKQLNSMSGLESIPDKLAVDTSLKLYSIPATSMVMAFYNNSASALNDVNVRKALTEAVDRHELVNLTSYPTRLINGPLLNGQPGYDSNLKQPNYNVANAKQLLKAAGWKQGKDGLRTKGGKILELNLRTQDTRNYAKTAQYLQQQWRAVGVKVNVQYYENNDLQSQIIANHDYDILLYGINIGVDPDVFAYWDSSQANVSSQGLNLSEYKSALASSALEAGRTRSQKQLRVIKYQSFLSQWRKDVPAMALYQPNFLYVSRGPVYNFEHSAYNSAADRFSNVSEWQIRQTRQSL